MCWASGDGVSPSRAGSGLVWQGQARHGEAWRGSFRPGTVLHGLRWQHGEPSGFPCRLHWWTRRGKARRGAARHGEARSGEAEHGSQTVARRVSAFPATLTRVDVAGLGRAWLGRARSGRAGRGKGCRQQHWGLRLPLLLSLEGRRGWLRPGAEPLATARLGNAGLGMARQGLTISALGASASSAGFFGIQIWRGTVRQGWARFDSA